MRIQISLHCCIIKLPVCPGRCGYGTDSNFSCQCNASCERYRDCCSDYAEICKAGATSCKGRCGEKYNSQNKCHCNSKCTKYNNCCSDYTDLCDSKSNHVPPVADPRLTCHTVSHHC
uniref:Uridylate-specific endoribonuclease n=1 Tax=Seriola lalandi dorsalis TaxID=1841481 RepID=A0A3B4WLR9_SERLL